MEEVVIVGAGIAGLATALALKKVGVRALILERSKELRTTGAALALFANAWVALDTLGVSDNLAALYAPFESGYMTDVKTKSIQEVHFLPNSRLL
ncbi:monooxygenase 3-like isoform X2 [Eucalyptus grandis]|uniref:monooxygenase 3-like isoform X2 n=1 Tax=Eucalyptus grandis TaxID=71139 RepID=UPI00192E8A2B|nr:monooxygenase 3-like isoform X2 [Eucalyptus grandis]